MHLVCALGHVTQVHGMPVYRHRGSAEDETCLPVTIHPACCFKEGFKVCSKVRIYGPNLSEHQIS